MKRKKKEIRVTFLPHQPPVFDCTARNVVYAKGRRAGGTMGAVNRLVEIAHIQRESRHLWVDTVQRNIGKLVARYFRPLLAGTEYRWNCSDRVLYFASGALCDFGSAERPETLEGFAYDYIWINEAGHVLKDESLYYNTLLPMMLEADNAQFFFIGAPKGLGLFGRMFDWGQDPKRADWRSFRHSSFTNPQLNREELERLRSHMPEREYRQEILAEFVTGEGAVFRDVAGIATAEREDSPQEGVPYVIGVDLARYGDFTVAWIGRADTRTGVFCDRFRRISWKLQVERIARLSRRYGGARLYVDATGVGDPVCEDLRSSGLPVEAMVMTAARKRDLVDGLAVAIEQQRLSIYPHEPTLHELTAYEQFPLESGRTRTSAPAGEHDDCVIALALCHWGMTAWGGDFILGSPTVSSEFMD